MKNVITSLIQGVFNRGLNAYYRLGAFVTITLMSFPVLADIPKSPPISGAGTSDFMKTGQAVFDEGATIGINVLFVVAGLVYIGSMITLYQQAKEKEKWGNFFKAAVIGLAVIVMVILLGNQLKKAIGS